MLLKNVIFLFTIYVYVNAEVLVTIPNKGTIRGRKEYSLRKNSFYAFQEIPFAKPPVGELRFREPQLDEGWEGILDATKNTKICYQQSNMLNVNQTLLENEDCLYLNVYTPKYPTANQELLPVMFHIYGGGFVSGAANFEFKGPHYFMEHDVIVVTANYRLGPFGFLATGDTVIPGNYGLKDQVLALKWVQDNIKYFGGDPQKVTMFGESAGGASVNFHYMSKKSEGLFRAGIAESGSTLSPWAYQKDYKKIAYDLATYVDSNFPRTSSSEELLKFLQSVPAGDLNKVAANSYPWWVYNDQIVQGFLFAPTIEPEHENAFISESMYEAVEKGHMNRAPMIIGICSEEGLTIRVSNVNDVSEFEKLAKEMDSNASILVNDNMHLTDPNQLEAAGEAIHRIYTDGAFVDDLGKSIRYQSDNSFNRGIIRYAEMQSKFSDIYFYQFSHYGPIFGERPYFEGAYKVGHANDANFLWVYGNWSTMDTQRADDILTSSRYLTLLTNFAKYLDPTPNSSSLLNDVDWPTVSPGNFQYLDINDTLTIQKDPKADTYSKWVDLYEQMAIKPYTTF
ncbi:unnamed protein product [Phaedon cochleariae]|uniref:Carboxylesterase type B domain-containing protein n=1 Tax=Phaedon cochleariae TaxID=80249 RepID=A0A9N9SLS5_PHACE|nr:unnamed protein product [Phaedon cochleariae]